MNKILKEGAIFSVIVLVVFILIGFILPAVLFKTDSQNNLQVGFPLPIAIYSSGVQTDYPLIIFLNFLIAGAIGFGISYIKNSAVKK
ncbi:MAG TPA: hypothetical protein VFF09_05005 [archaeon]|nr:hypothetical protein [archaeon]